VLGILVAQVSFPFLFCLFVWGAGRPARIGPSRCLGFLFFPFVSVWGAGWPAKVGLSCSSDIPFFSFL